ncbi:MAG: hypothetical protein DRJ08_05670 [Acidobacteria bacterium]|nr:MAG: hypothetical protein DRJ14_02905 [Acidobacteriota bacterium]RLE21373.1 MAG: hypothetical protein DRJ08_05670 [Acidobacteriota bacterium]
MKHLSEKRFLFWISSLCLILTVSCVRKPVENVNPAENGQIVSTFFRVEGKVGAQSIHGVRAYFQADSRGNFMLNLLTAMNSPVSTVFFDGKSLTVVDYRSKAVLTDKTPPFSLGPEIPFHLDIASLAGFYKRGLTEGQGLTQTFSWGKLILTEKRRIVVLFNDGSNLLLTPLSAAKKRKGSLLSLKIPQHYRQIDAKD